MFLLCMNCFELFTVNGTAATEIYTYCHTLALHDALPISLATRLGLSSPGRPIRGLPPAAGRAAGHGRPGPCPAAARRGAGRRGRRPAGFHLGVWKAGVRLHTTSARPCALGL